MRALQRAAHAVYAIRYHFVWCPKYHRSVIEDGLAQMLRSLLEEIAGRYAFVVEACTIAPAYVHLFISASPRWSPAMLMQKIKGITSTELLRRMPSLRDVCGGGLWKRGYYVATSGELVTEELIARYVARSEDCAVDAPGRDRERLTPPGGGRERRTPAISVEVHKKEKA